MITLNHFLRGPLPVVPFMKDGNREWLCPKRPMLRPMADCEFIERRVEIDAMLATAEPGPAADERERMLTF